MHTNIATRAYAVALKSGAGKASTEVAEITGLSVRQVNRIYARAIERGFDPDHRPVHIEDSFLADAPRTGRPRKQGLRKDIVKHVRYDRFGRRRNTCADIAGGFKGAQGLQNKCVSDHGLASTAESKIQKNEADEEAWTDEEEEKGAAQWLLGAA